MSQRGIIQFASHWRETEVGLQCHGWSRWDPSYQLFMSDRSVCFTALNGHVVGTFETRHRQGHALVWGAASSDLWVQIASVLSRRKTPQSPISRNSDSVYKMTQTILLFFFYFVLFFKVFFFSFFFLQFFIHQCLVDNIIYLDFTNPRETWYGYSSTWLIQNLSFCP